ncbi:hypothetical protein [Saccharothrix longispora]|uniref:hypothetical protein n=1 Tax=Saccharothrix longispora TaxID=33920 RepID=UPI0028FD70A4|nr:hypothetical protein [Saccharothrix longispora]MBY8850101.1 hypothetical protein [Saccharothrix sp. MB29]MDU0292875.1 hypothetical protein [Saccharothrix longispora]
MSLTSTARPDSDSRLALVTWSLVALGLAGPTAFLTTPAWGAVAGVVAALVGLAAHALTRASNAVDRILDEELDHR